jgi:hypothetical protein
MAALVSGDAQPAMSRRKPVHMKARHISGSICALHADSGSQSLKSSAGYMLPRLLFTSLIFFAAHRSASAQKLVADNRAAALPEEPQPQPSAYISQNGMVVQANLPDGKASISGTVVDADGAQISGATLVLLGAAGQLYRSVVSDANGGYIFTRLPPGKYNVRASYPRFTSTTSSPIELATEEVYSSPVITLLVATTATEITVQPTEVIAEEQIKAEEKQRFLGVFPNFYMSFDPNPAPMTTKQKFRLATRDTFDWTSWVGISLSAGIEQANNTYAGYGQGAAGYGKRWAAQFGDGRISDFMDHAVFASLFHEDPRYFYQGTGTKKSRIYHATASSVITRGDNGKMMPNYSYVLGTMVAGAAANAYYPHADRGANLVFTSAAIGIAGRAGGNVLKELFAKRLTTNVPATSVDPTAPHP